MHEGRKVRDEDMRDQGTLPGRIIEWKWFVVALLLPNSGLWFYAALGYQLAGPTLALEYAARWMSFSLLYWLPIGLLLNRRGRSRWLQAFGLSLMGYCGALTLVYPMAGSHFAPSSLQAAGIYFLGNVLLFLLVSGLWLSSRYQRWSSIVLLGTSTLLFIGGIVGPISLVTGTDDYRWPRHPDRLNIVNANLIQLPEGTIVTGKNLHIEKGRIVEWVDALKDTSQWEQFDAHGAFAMPGMIDVHTHLDAPLRSLTEPFDFGYLLESEFSKMADHRRAYLDAGITTIRDLGGPARHVYDWRTDIDRHVLLGPRLFAVGRLITSPGGHPVSTIWEAYPYLSAQGAILPNNANELRSALENNDREGPSDGVKIVYGTIGHAKSRLSPQLLQEAIRWAKEKNKVSIVHVETPEEIRDAVALGVAGLEHVASAGELPEALIQEIASKRIFVDPTFGEFATVLKLSNTPDADQFALMTQSYAVARKLKQAGTRFVLGTDAPLVAFGQGYLDEIDHFRDVGFTHAEILTVATIHNAAYLGQEGRLGCLQAGCSADILFLNQNPLMDLKALSASGRLIMREGVLVKTKP